MSYDFSDLTLGLLDLNSNHAAQGGISLGHIAQAIDPAKGSGEFIFLQGVASMVVNSWVLYNSDDWATTLLGANQQGGVAIAMAPTVAGEFGWFQITG